MLQLMVAGAPEVKTHTHTHTRLPYYSLGFSNCSVVLCETLIIACCLDIKFAVIPHVMLVICEVIM